MKDYIEIESHGVTTELYPNGRTIEVYCGSNYVGEIGADTLYSVANSDEIVIPKRTWDTEK